MFVFFPNGMVFEIGGFNTAVVLPASDLSTIAIINSTDYSSSAPTYTCTDANEAANFMRLITEGMQKGLRELILVSAAASTVTAILPNTGSVNGGTMTLVTGTGFRSSGSVTVGGNPALFFKYIDATHLMVLTPAHAAGVVDVVYTDSRGSATGVGLYTYA
jgi:hypothetical protein